jgi:hypothetical protein
LLRPQLAQSDDDFVAERAGGEDTSRFGLDQGNRQARIEPLQGPRAGPPGKSATDHDDPRIGTLREGGKRQYSRHPGAHRAHHEVAPPEGPGHLGSV